MKELERSKIEQVQIIVIACKKKTTNKNDWKELVKNVKEQQ